MCCFLFCRKESQMQEKRQQCFFRADFLGDSPYVRWSFGYIWATHKPYKPLAARTYTTYLRGILHLPEAVDTRWGICQKWSSASLTLQGINTLLSLNSQRRFSQTTFFLFFFFIKTKFLFYYQRVSSTHNLWGINEGTLRLFLFFLDFWFTFIFVWLNHEKKHSGGYNIAWHEYCSSCYCQKRRWEPIVLVSTRQYWHPFYTFVPNHTTTS